MTDIQVVKEELQTQIHDRLEMDREMTDEEIGEVIDTVIMSKSKEMYISASSKLALRQDLFNAIRRLDLLQELIDGGEEITIITQVTDAIRIHMLTSVNGQHNVDAVFENPTERRFARLVSRFLMKMDDETGPAGEGEIR